MGIVTQARGKQEAHPWMGKLTLIRRLRRAACRPEASTTAPRYAGFFPEQFSHGAMGLEGIAERQRGFASDRRSVLLPSRPRRAWPPSPRGEGLGVRGFGGWKTSLVDTKFRTSSTLESGTSQGILRRATDHGPRLAGPQAWQSRMFMKTNQIDELT